MSGRFHSISWPGSLILVGVLCSVAAVFCAAPARSEDATGVLAQALKDEAGRVELIERLSKTVIAIFPAAPEEDKTPAGPQGGGSGVIIDAQGYALTNYHVVREAAKVNVGLSDGKVYSAAVWGRDPTGDVAIIKIEGGPFTFAQPGDSDKLELGQWVLAMGNPFGLATDFKPTVTQGIVSGLHRYLPGTIGGDLIYTDCIQIDAPINPGNSGGPLFDAGGRLVGVNGRVTARNSRGKVNSGVGFAVPINQIKEFLPELLTGKRVHHAVLGVELSEGQEDVTIKQVLSGTAAEKAGLQPGDVVRRFQGLEIRSEMELINRIGILPAGKRVRIAVERAEREYEIEVALGERPTGTEPAVVKPETPASPPEKPVETPPAPEPLSPDAVARRFVEATGGYEEHDAVKDIISIGRTQMLMLGRVWVGGRVTQYEIGPAKLRQETVYVHRGNSVKQITTFNGKTGWIYTDGDIRDMTEEEASGVKGELEAFEQLTTRGAWSSGKAESSGTEILEGQTLVVVTTKDKEGDERRWSFDPKTWLLVRYVRKSPGNHEVLDDRISDYRRVGKMLLPFQFVRYVGSVRVQTTRLESVEINRGVKEEILGDKPPASIGPKVY